MVLELDGSKTRVVTAMLGRKSLRGAHDAPAYVAFGLFGSMRSERVRPPTLPGPSGCHVPSAPLVEALPSPTPPPPVPFGNSPSPASGVSSSASDCAGIRRFLA